MSASDIHLPGIIARVRDVRRWRKLDIVLWCAQALLALVFINAGWAKRTGDPRMIELFTAVGVGQWLRYVTALLELGGAVLLVVPRTTRVGAALLACVMLGAVTAHLVVLHVPPTAPGVLLLLCAFVLWGRWRLSARRAVPHARSF